MCNNPTLAQLFIQNMQLLGRQVKRPDFREGTGSTDMGNVSHLVPSIHAWVSIVSTDVGIHTPQFAAASASEAGMFGFIDAAKALAMTIVDLLANPDILIKVKEEFQQGK